MSTRKDSNYNIDNDPYHESHYQAAGIDTNKIGFWKSSEAKKIFKRVANKQNIGFISRYNKRFSGKHNDRIINWQKDEFMKTPGGVDALTQSQEDIQAMYDNEAELDAIRVNQTVDGSVSVPYSSTTADVQVTGGGVSVSQRGTEVRTDTTESKKYRNDAIRLQGEKDALQAKLKAQGGKQTFKDPEVLDYTARINDAKLAEERTQIVTSSTTTYKEDVNGNEIPNTRKTSVTEYTLDAKTGKQVYAKTSWSQEVDTNQTLLTQADADRLNAEAYEKGGYAPRTLEDLQDEANDDAFLASLPTYNGIQFPNQQALDEYKANNPTAGLNTNTSTDDVDDDPVPNGNPKTERDTFASDNSTQAEANQAFNDAADAQQEADELLESGNMEAYNVAQLKANTALSKAQGLQEDADFEAEDEADTDMFQADFDRENLDDEYASRPEPSVSELRGGGTSKGDWRVRLRLAPQSDYLYNAPDPGILSPLAKTDGIIFPYVPRIDTVHQARYNNYDLPHSNYRGYFYAGSHQERVIVSATFTAQDTKEANYMLATLHFLRSCTKMFYGQDMHRGTPPPLVFLSGLGEHQFNEHPCAVELVNINLPNDVDYIKAGDSGTFSGDFMSPINSSRTSPASSFSGALSRLFGAGMSFGGTPSPTYTSENIFKAERNGTTMMPTKMEINFNLVPIQTRDQISNEYSLKDYASGSLLKKGFW